MISGTIAAALLASDIVRLATTGKFPVGHLRYAAVTTAALLVGVGMNNRNIWDTLELARRLERARLQPPASPSPPPSENGVLRFPGNVGTGPP